MKVRVGTLCSGYDSQCLAMERLKRNFPDFDYELVFWSEFDPKAKDHSISNLRLSPTMLYSHNGQIGM